MKRGTSGRLWRDFEAFVFDEPDHPFSFSRLLARENGRSASFTARAIAEYRRFLYLAVATDHEVTPSEVVDRVWHLHLTYSRSYWERLCGALLKRLLHRRGATSGRHRTSNSAVAGHISGSIVRPMVGTALLLRRGNR